MDIHSEAFEQLLAEALRSGPASPEWHQAVEALRAAGSEGEEYAVLCRAREDLESGREYRSVHAGPGFTQKLMTQIEREQASRWNLPTGNIVALLAVGVIAIAAGVIAWMVFSSNREGAERLHDKLFATPVVVEDFAAAAGTSYTKIGLLPLTTTGEVKVDAQPRAGGNLVGGGVHLNQALSPEQPYAVEAQLEFANTQTDLTCQLFITDTSSFAADTGITSHELVCFVEAGKLRVVLPDGQTAAQIALGLDDKSRTTIRVRIDREFAAFEQNGRIFWSGPHRLAPDKQRLVGVRYLSRGGENSTGLSVQHLKVLRP